MNRTNILRPEFPPDATLPEAINCPQPSVPLPIGERSSHSKAFRPCVGLLVPLDLSVNMGFLDGPNHSEVFDALRTGAKKVMDRGFPAGTFAVTPEQARQAYALGYRQFFLGFDAMFVPATVQLFLSQMKT